MKYIYLSFGSMKEGKNMVMLITIKTNAVVGDVQNDDLDNKSSVSDNVM